jgi:hypothetical protein
VCSSDLLYPALGFFSGLLGKFLVNKRFFSYLILSAAALALTAACQMFRLLVFDGAPGMALLRTAGLQVLWSLPFSVPAYFACKALSGRRFD